MSSAQNKAWESTWLQGCQWHNGIFGRWTLEAEKTASRVSQRRKKCPYEENLLRSLLWERDIIQRYLLKTHRILPRIVNLEKEGQRHLYEESLFSFFENVPPGMLIPWEFCLAFIKAEGKMSSLLCKRHWVRKSYCLCWMGDAGKEGRVCSTELPATEIRCELTKCGKGNGSLIHNPLFLNKIWYFKIIALIIYIRALQIQNAKWSH